MVRNHSRRSKLVILAIGVAIIVSLFMLSQMQQQQLPDGVVSANGRTEATEVDITTRYGGRLEQVLVREGDSIRKDQVLARFDNRELNAQLRKAEAEVRRIQQEKNSASALIAQRRSELSLARKALERSEGLYESDSISLERLQRDETAVETAKAALLAAQAQFSNAVAAVEAAVAGTELIKTQIDDSILRSTINGRVLYRLAEPGEVLPAGGRVLTILDPFDIYMTVFLPTRDAVRVAIGDEARVIVDGMDDQVVRASVSYVAPQAQFTPKEVETRTEREKLMFRVKVRLDEGFLRKYEALAKTGMPGVAYIRIDSTPVWPDTLQIDESREH